ncbi:MAG: hypothetical protein IT243_03790 [Bacteroidia bacterium]|nr:hypothetical protein [Bacteroidia bacterium]
MKKITVTTLLLIGITFCSYSQTISGTADPCTNENISYTFTQVSGFCADVPCTPTSGPVKHSFVTNDGWSAIPAGAAVIENSSSLTTNIKWNCGNGNYVSLKFTAKCHTFTPVTINDITTCVENVTEQATTKNITIKCPTPLIISGPTNIACCDVSNKTFSVGNTFGQTSLFWEVSTATGWEIIGSNTGSSITATAGSTGSSQQVKVTSGYTGCNFETKAVGILNVSRLPIIEEDIAPSLP